MCLTWGWLKLILFGTLNGPKATALSRKQFDSS